ncbi:Transcriptional regulator [Vibrio crassostreae]|nr:Transcriptional regulator [Vibrio crassostreae]
MFKHELPSDSVGLQLWVAYNKWHSEVMRLLKPLNINHTQFVILASILWCNKNKNETTQTELVNITGLDKMTLSKSMKALVANALIIKDKGVRDSRSFSLRLTETGKTLTTNAIVQVEELDQLYFESLKDERGRFISLLAGLKTP